MRSDLRLRACFALVVVFIACGVAGAQMLATSARQLPAGSLRLETFYQGAQDQTVRFNVGNPGNCVANNGAGGLPFGCSASNRVDAKGSGGMGVVKLTYQPWESFQYYGSVGVGDYSLSVPSATTNNQLTGDNPGIAATFGVKAVLAADTEFTPAIAVDASISKSHYWFNRGSASGPGSGVGSINQTLDFWQYQVAVEASHVFKISDNGGAPVDKEHPIIFQTWSVEPYGGLKWTRTRSDLHDAQTGSHAGGFIDVASPFVGVRLPAYAHETFFAEASFVEGYQYSAGMEIRFK